MQPLSTLPESLVSEFKRLRGRLRGVSVAGGVGLTALVIALSLFMAFAADYIFDLPVAWRVGLLFGVLGAGVVTAVTTILIPMLRKVEDTELAAMVEANHPEFEERLLSTVEFADEDAVTGSPLMHEWMLSQTVEQSEQVDFADVVDAQPAIKRCWLGAASILALIIPFLFAGNAYGVLFSRFLNPWGNYERVQNLILVVDEGDRVVARGTDVDVAARVEWRFKEAERPDSAWLEWIPDSAGTERRRMDWDEDAQAYTVFLPRVDDSFNFYVSANRSRTKEYRVQVVEPVEVASLSIDIKPPSYTGEPAQHHDVLLGEILAIEQSEIELIAQFNKPVEEAELLWLDGETQFHIGELQELPDGTSIVASQKLELSADGQTATWDDTLKLEGQSGRFLIRATDEHGLQNELGTYRRLTIVPDEAPEILWGDREQQIEAKPDDILDIPMYATDDFGVASFELHYEFVRGATLTEEDHFSAPIEIVGTDKVRNVFRVDISKLDVTPGMQISIRGRATDERPVPEPNETWSDTRIIQIKEDANPYGEQTLIEQQQQTKEVLDALQNEVEKQQEQAKDLKKEAEEDVKQQLDFENDEELAELQDQIDQLKQQLEKLSSVFEESPLFEKLAQQAEKIANDQLAKAAESAEKAAEAELKDKPKELARAEDQLKKANEQLEKLQEQFNEVSELQRDLLELNRLATNTERLADNVEQLEKQQQEMRQENAQPTPQEQAAQAQQHQNLIQQHQALEDGLEELTERRPELIEAARDELKKQLEELAERAEELMQKQDSLTQATERTKHEQVREAQEMIRKQEKLIQEARELAKESGLVEPQRKALREESANLERARNALRDGNEQKAQQENLETVEQLQQTAEALKKNAELPAEPQAAAEELAKRQEAVANALKKLDQEVDSPQAEAERKAIAAEQNAIQQATDQLPSTDEAKDAREQAMNAAKDAANSTKENKIEEAANKADQAAEKLSELAEKLADAEPHKDAEKNQQQTADNADKAEQLANDIAELSEQLAQNNQLAQAEQQPMNAQPEPNNGEEGMPEPQAGAEQQPANGEPMPQGENPEQGEPQAEGQPDNQGEPMNTEQPNEGEAQPGNPEQDQPQQAAPSPELIEKQSQLAKQMKALKEQVQSAEQGNNKAIKPAQHAASRAEHAAKNAEQFNFDEGAKAAQEAAKAANELSEALAESDSSESLQQAAEIAAEQQEQLAQEMQAVAESTATEKAMQAQVQQELQQATTELGEELAAQAQTLNADPVSQQNAGEQAMKAADYAQTAQAEQAQTNQEIQQGNQGEATKESRQAKDALNKTREAARQASSKVKDTGDPKKNNVPGVVGEQVAQASQQLQAAGEQLEQLGTPDMNAQANAQPAENGEGQTPSESGEGQGEPMEGGETGEQGESQQGQQGQSQQPGSSPTQSLRQAAQAMRQAAQQMGLAQSQQPGDSGEPGEEGQPNQEGQGGNEAGEFGTDQLAKLLEIQAELGKVTERDWGQLNSELNTELIESSHKNPKGDYARLIKRYFKELSKNREPVIND